MVRTRRLAVLLLAVASLVLVVPANAGIGQSIGVDEYAYDPAADTIAQPTLTYFLVFENHGATTHSAVSDGGMFDTKAIAPAGSSQISIQGAGTYPYHCAFHPVRMQGVFRVRPKASDTLVGVGEPIALQIAPDAIKTLYVHDVQRRRNGGEWKTVRHGTGESRDLSSACRGGVGDFRVPEVHTEVVPHAAEGDGSSRAQKRSNRIGRFTSWIAFVTSIPRGHASVQLKVVRQRKTPVFSERIFRRSRPASSRLSKMNRCAFTIAAGPT